MDGEYDHLKDAPGSLSKPQDALPRTWSFWSHVRGDVRQELWTPLCFQRPFSSHLLHDSSSVNLLLVDSSYSLKNSVIIFLYFSLSCLSFKTSFPLLFSFYSLFQCFFPTFYNFYRLLFTFSSLHLNFLHCHCIISTNIRNDAVLTDIVYYSLQSTFIAYSECVLGLKTQVKLFRYVFQWALQDTLSSLLARLRFQFKTLPFIKCNQIVPQNFYRSLPLFFLYLEI